MKNIVFNKLIISLIVIFFLLLSLYAVMLLDTNSLVDEVKDVMRGNVSKTITNGTPLKKYNRIDDLSNAKVEVKITRLFVLHSFSDGYMWVKYTRRATRNGKLILGSKDVASKWKIHKENGKWKIVDIEERA